MVVRMVAALLLVLSLGGWPSGAGADSQAQPEAAPETAAPEAAAEGANASQEGEAPAEENGEADVQAAEAEQPPPPEPFSFDLLTERARELAGESFVDTSDDLPAAIAELDYDAYRDIRYKRDRALWRGERLYEAQFFHLGFLYRKPVAMNVIVDGQVESVPFATDLFDYGRSDTPDADDPDLGFVGLRLHFPLHHGTFKDEVAAFLGGSYFRILGRRQIYGLSARGLAIDTATPDGEEFPYFREFWIERPEPEQMQATVYGLLESRRAVGAYRFVLSPGTRTIVDVTARVIFRDGVGKLGVAPLTSMFFFGPNSSAHIDDFRPQVHDSDGLLMRTGGGEWIWRPLANPPELRISAFMDRNPGGFGLLQRDREIANHLDLEALYHRRPSYWVEPVGDWGEGVVELVEIPTREEVHDNIVAYWSPKEPPRGGEEIELQYRITAMLDDPVPPTLGRTLRTRIGSAVATPGGRDRYEPETRLFVVDFGGGDLTHLTESEPVQANLTASSGRIENVQVVRNPESREWRVVFRLTPDGDQPSDMRLSLQHRGRRLTETWTYLWRPGLK